MACRQYGEKNFSREGREGTQRENTHLTFLIGPLTSSLRDPLRPSRLKILLRQSLPGE